MVNEKLKKSYKLSIIIPHYNTSDLLEKLLSTIPKDKNIEVIVIDDKSEDKHIEYIEDLRTEKKYIDFLLLKNKTFKKGAGTCRNIGLDDAKGEWILFADADDYFTDNFYKSVEEYFSSENDVIYFIPTSIDLDTGDEAQRHIEYKNILENYISDQSLENELKVRYEMLTPWSKLMKREFIEENNIEFDEAIASNDVMFSTKVGYCMQRFSISDNVIYIVTKNYGSLTVNLSEEVFDARLKVRIQYYNFLKYNLIKEQFNMFNISFSGWLFSSFRYGILKLIKTLVLLKKEKVKIFDNRILNIKFIMKKLFHRYKYNKQNKKYYVEN